MAAICAQVDTWKDPDTVCTWTYITSVDTVTISAISSNPTGILAIPSQLGGKPVTSIGEHAFDGYDDYGECGG